MKTFLAIAKVLAIVFAIIVVATSLSVQENPADWITVELRDRIIFAGLVFASVTFLHWLIYRYITAADSLPREERKRLFAHGRAGDSRGFFRGCTGAGYLFIGTYVFALTDPAMLSRLRSDDPFSGGFIFGIVFLFCGLAARARGIVVELLRARETHALETRTDLAPAATTSPEG